MVDHVFADNVREGSVTVGTGDFTTTGGISPIPTAAVGKALQDVLSVGQKFDYAIHHRTLNEWEVGIGTYTDSNLFSRDRVVAGSNGAAKVNFSAGDKAVWIGPTSELRNHFAGLENISNYGAVNGSDNAAVIAATRTSAGVNKPIFAGFGSAAWGLKGTLLDFTGDQAGEGSAFSLVQGTDAAPATNPNAIIYLEKRVNADESNHNDHGGLDVRMKKVSGSNNAYAAFFGAEDAGGDAGIISPFIAAARTSNPNTQRLYAMDVFVEKTVAINNGFIVGHAVGIIDSSGEDNGWHAAIGDGTSIGGMYETYVGRGTFGLGLRGGEGTGYYTGLIFDQNSILPDSFSTSSEAIRIRGGATAPDKYKGIWFHDGFLTTGINFAGPNYTNNSIMVIPKDGAIMFGQDHTANTTLSWTSLDKLNINNGALAVNGNQVIGGRITGWGAATGTATRTSFSTSGVTTAQLAEHVKALIDDLLNHGLIGN